MEKILEVIHCASCELQNSSLLLPVAINLIKSTKTNLLRMRSDDVWVTIEKLAYDKALTNGIEGPSEELRPQRIKHFNKNLNEYYVTTTTSHTNSTNNTSIKIEVLYTVIDSSVVWKYFKKDLNNPNEAQCLICKSSYKRSNGTSNLMEHLKRKHMCILDRDNMLLQNLEQESINEPGTSRGSQPQSTSSNLPVSYFTTSSNCNEPTGSTMATTESEPPLKRQKQLVLSNRFGAPSELQIKAFYEAIVRMIAEDLQPLSIVENEGFRNMVKLLDSRYQIPSRRALGRTIIPNIYSNVRNKVQTLLNDTSFIALTTDIWTSINTDSFITITAHFFPKGHSQLKTVVLCTKKLHHGHTGVYLAEIMTSELNSWGILDKITAIVTDSGANIKSAIRLMNIQHIPCTAHKLNLVVQQALYLSEDDSVGEESHELHDSGKIKLILKKCRVIVGFFKRSEVGNRILGEKQTQLGFTQLLKLKQDVRTRWNSTLIMLERLVKLKEPLTVTMISVKEAPSNLTPEEWVIIEDIVPLLRPFNSLTIELSAEQYPTISKVVPLLRGLQTSLNAKTPKTSLGSFIKSNLMLQVNRRFEGIEKQSLTPYFSRATLLDPRCKKAAFAVEENASDAEKNIILEIARSLTNNTLDAEREVPTEQIEEDSENLWNFLQNRVNNVQGQTTSTSSAISLMRQYLNMPYQHLNCNVAEWWLSHKSVLHPYPTGLEAHQSTYPTVPTDIYKIMENGLNIITEFTSGLQILFNNVKKHKIVLPETENPWTLGLLLFWIKDNILVDKDKSDLFMKGNTVRPGIIVAVNDQDWELLGDLKYQIKNNDNITFISTLHGG
ncbi:hypothetical protein QTP88_017034 [Uroleucon formosanum]